MYLSLYGKKTQLSALQLTRPPRERRIKMAELLLGTDRLTKTFGKHKAVNEVSLHVERGSVYGFIGKNGAGKTTFMKMVCGLSAPTSGGITLFGKTGAEIRKQRHKIGCLIEDPGIYPKLSAFENVRLKCLALGCYNKEYVQGLLEKVGLGDTKKKQAGRFSLGMRQRLGIALALVGEPELLVLDEPINGLDPQGIAEVRDTIHSLSQDGGITILISSHILDELSKIATHYGIINDGVLIREMSASQMLEARTDGISIVIDNFTKASEILGGLGYEFSLVEPFHISVKADKQKAAQINRALVTGGVEVSELSVHSEDLESYYLKLTGGVQNA